MLGGPGSHFDMLNGQPFIPNLRPNSGIIHYGQIWPRIYLKGLAHLLSSQFKSLSIVHYFNLPRKKCQLVLDTKGKTYTVLTERTSWKTATYFIIMSYGVGFYRNKGAGAPHWCLRKCRSLVSHLGITFAWELRIYSRGSNCSRKGPEATSEGLAHRCLKGVQQP